MANRRHESAPTIEGLDFICVERLFPLIDEHGNESEVNRGDVLHYGVSEEACRGARELDPDYPESADMGSVFRYRHGGRDRLNRLVASGVAQLRDRGYWVHVHGHDVYANKPW